MRPITRWAVLLMMLSCAPLAGAADLFVRAGGSDRNDGRSPGSAWATIQHAYRNASPGDTVYIGGGTYRDRLGLSGRSGRADAPIRLVGDTSGDRTGDAGEVIIEQDGGYVVAVRADHVHLLNLTIRGSGRNGSTRPLRWDGGDGGLVRNCTITNASGDLLRYGGRGALRVENSTLRVSAGNGVHTDTGRIELVDCTIEEIAGDGVRAQNTGSAVLIERTVIRTVGAAGVRAENGSADVVASVLDTVSGQAMRVQNSRATLRALGVTVYNSGTGLLLWGGRAEVRGVVFHTIAGHAIDARNNAPVSNGQNLFWRVGGSTHSGVASGGGDVNADPILGDPARQDYAPAGASPVIDAAGDLGRSVAETGADALDLLGGSRPLARAWDIGAVEHGSAPAPLPVPYATGFEDGLHEAWSDQSSDNTSALGTFMGPFGMSETRTPSTSAVVRTVPGERYVLRFDAYVFDGWDISGNTQDVMLIEVDGVEIMRTSFDPGGDGVVPAASALGNFAYARSQDEVFRDIVVRFTATTDRTTLTLRGVHTGNDEGWGIDNLSIDVADAAQTPFFESFASGTGEGWTSDIANGSVEDLSVFGGAFASGDAAELAVETTPGAMYTLAFDLFVLGDWDGEDVSVLVDGTPIFSESFELGTYPRVNGRAPDHATDADNDGITDLVYRVVTTTFVAEDAETVIRFESGLDEGAGDEAFGIDNVMVFAGGGTPGLSAAWVDAGRGLRRLSDLDFDSPTATSIESHIGWENQRDEFYPDGPDQYFGVRLTGQIIVPSTGEWRFRLGSDDGSRLDLNGSTLIDNDGLHSFRWREARTTLDAGAHDLVVEFFENGGWKGLILQWLGPGMADWETVPGWAYRRGASMFTDVSVEVGFDLDTGADASNPGGLVFVDLDQDGDLDAIAGGPSGAVLEYDGGVYREARRADLRGQLGVLDVDRDGLLDLYLPLRERFELNTGTPASWTSLGDGGFGDPRGTPAGVAADLNADGRADLLAFAESGNHVALLLDPEGEGDAFDLDLPLLGSMGLNDPGDYGTGGFVASGDANNDGRPDFYYDRAGGRLFLSTEDGDYIEDQTLVRGSASGVGAAWGDFDDDGNLDLLIPGNGTAPRLLRNGGDAFAFDDVAGAAGLTTTGVQRAAAWGDADNDGDLDLYLATGAGEPNVLYLNNGDGTFTSSDLVPTVTADTLDAAWVDIDGDGDTDLALLTVDGLVMMRNELDRADTLRVVAGPALSRRVASGAIGTRVELFDRAGTRLGMRELGVARGFGGTGPFEATFSGIDTSATYRVEVTWPGGATSSAEVVPASATASVGGNTLERTFDLALLKPPGVRVIRWTEVSPDGE